MTDPGSGRGADGVAEAVVKERRGISLVWLVPVVAVLIGGWLIFQALTERGPSVVITFKTAEGLEAGKTQIKFKDVVIGQVESIVLPEDLSHVEVRASLTKGAGRYLTESSRFWVVRARLSAGRVSGLSTLLSGAYIGFDPSTEGARASRFVGLEEPPAFTSEDPGSVYTLRADSLGSLDVGTPVFFRRIEVGQVVSFELDASGDHVTVEVFVHAPHDQRITRSTLWWNASGIDVSMGPEGLEVDSISLTSMLIGGIAFETPDGSRTSAPPDDGFVFPLYANRRATDEPVFQIVRPFLLRFEQASGRLQPGAPVEFKGIQIGEVRDAHLAFDEQGLPYIPVLIAIQPERLRAEERTDDLEEDGRRGWDAWVRRGLRAQIKTANLITGAQAIAFDFHPDAPPAAIDWSQEVPELPTLTGGIDALAEGLGDFVAKLNRLPLDQIGADLRASLASLSRVLADAERATPRLVGTLENAETTLASANTLIAPDAQLSEDLRRALRELADAARSLRLLAEQLEQNPESLIRGKRAEP